MRDYKTAVFVEVIPVPPESGPSTGSFYDSVIFAQPDEPAPLRRCTVDRDELQEYIDAPVENQAVNPLLWWKVSSLEHALLNLFL